MISNINNPSSGKFWFWLDLYVSWLAKLNFWSNISNVIKMNLEHIENAFNWIFSNWCNILRWKIDSLRKWLFTISCSFRYLLSISLIKKRFWWLEITKIFWCFVALHFRNYHWIYHDKRSLLHVVTKFSVCYPQFEITSRNSKRYIGLKIIEISC